jgi:hypothetical protein
MSIGKSDPDLEGQDRPCEWCVRVSQSVAENVPASILRAWIIVESFTRDQASCWPGNRALAARLGVKIRAAQLAVESLEDHGIAERRPMPGNRRAIYLIRRTSDPMAGVEWKALANRAGNRASGRVALAVAAKAERKAHRPKIRIVS